MNNYCTNCGKSLKKDDLKCSLCDTPIIDLPDDYVFSSKTSKKYRKFEKISLILILVFVLIIITISFSQKFFKNKKINKLQTKYVEPFIKENFPKKEYTVEYESSGKCIIAGECSLAGTIFDTFLSCDNGNTSCKEYEYLDGCQSYYYSVKTDKKEYIITVFQKDKKYSVVNGKNIYGKDESYEKDVAENE